MKTPNARGQWNRLRSLGCIAAVLPLLWSARANADQLTNFDAYAASTPLRAAQFPFVKGESKAPGAFVASRDEHRGVPTFLWATKNAHAAAFTSAGGSALAGATAEAAAKMYISEYADYYGVSAQALATLRVVRVLDVGQGGITVVMRQRVGGVDLFHNDVKVLMNRSLDLVAIGGNLHAAAIPSPKIAPFQVTRVEAMALAFDDMFGASLTAAHFIDTKQPQGDYLHYQLTGNGQAASGVRLSEPARAEQIYFPMPDRLVPAYYVEVVGGSPQASSADAYSYVIAADDGRILYRENLTHSDIFNYRVWADPAGDKRPADGPLVDYSPYPDAAPNNTFPGFAAPSLVSMEGFDKHSDPWLPAAATVSTGNNVDAYTDDDAPDGFSSGDTRAFTTSANTFDLTYDVTASPQSSPLQKEAAVTDLFYVNNWLHDWWYDSGFDEAGGNAQSSNYGRGGVENDILLAEGQNGAPGERNNSNMQVPGDGMSPRMQMLVWDGPAVSGTLNPGAVTFKEGQSGFSSQSFQLTGSLILAEDGTAPDVNDICDPITNVVTGQIAVVDRGTCSFKSKALAAQTAGALGVILINNQASNNPPPLNDDPSITTPITIPMVSVTQAAGDTIRAAITAGGATATIQSQLDFDGTIDNSIIAHEWGHYLHLRHVACGSPTCSAESEGWADFDALMMMVRPGDDFDGAYAIAQYATVSFPEPAYYGIRRYPYSTDLGKDPLTFKYITSGVALPTTAPVSPTAQGSDNSEAHAAGEIWAAMLFESYIGLLKQTTLATPPYDYTEAHRRMGNYVVGGMTMAPANPTYTEQRDAVLASAAAADPNDLQIIAQGFAKRGAGTCAVSPARDSTDLSGVVESFVVAPNVSIDSVSLDDKSSPCDSDGYLDAGEIGVLTVNVTNNGATALTSASASVTTATPGITFPDGPKISFGDIGIFASTTGTLRVALDAAVTKKDLAHLTVTSDAVGCSSGTQEAYFPINVDEAATSSASDDVEAKTSVWKATGTGKIWSRTAGTAGNHLWSGIDFSSPSDSALSSPLLQVSPTDAFVMTFTHRHSFESSQGVNWDGAVIEVSDDGGSTWVDISTLGNPGYTGTIGDPDNHAQNVLRNKMGYVATNASWPSTDTVTVDMGTKLAGKSVKVRFRIGTDDAVGDVGWQIDDIGFQGITNTPFASLNQNAMVCGDSSSATTSTGTEPGAGGGGGAGGSDSLDTEVKGGCDCEVASDSPQSPWAGLMAVVGLTALFKRRSRAIEI